MLQIVFKITKFIERFYIFFISKLIVFHNLFSLGSCSRSGTITFLTLGGITIVSIAVAPLTKGFDTVLPYRAWVPYNLDNRISFWLTYLLQAVGSIAQK